MTFDQEAHGRLRFQRNPLKVVVAQVRFEPVHQLDTAEVHAAIQGALADRYPRSLPEMKEMTFAITSAGPAQSEMSRVAIRFADPPAKQIVSIGPSMASLETSDYRGWEQFRQDLEQMLLVVAANAQIGQVTRFGLRYVDEVEVPGVSSIDEWADVIADSLLGTPDSLARDPRVIQSLQRVTMRIGDDGVNLRHGLARRDRSGVIESVYLIDTDMSSSRPRPWDVEAIMADAERYHAWSTNIFVRSLTESGIARMGGEPQ